MQENDTSYRLEVVTIKREPQDEDESQEGTQLDIKHSSYTDTGFLKVDVDCTGDDEHIEDIFLPEIKLEVLEEENVNYGKIAKTKSSNGETDGQETVKPTNNKPDSPDLKKLNRKKIETAESREKRLIRSKLYYRMRKAKQKGEVELLKTYEKEKSKNKLETLEERAKRLESKEISTPLRKETEDRRVHRLQLLWQMKKTKELLNERKKIISQSNRERIDMSKLVQEAKRKARLQQLLIYQHCISSKAKRKPDGVL